MTASVENRNQRTMIAIVTVVFAMVGLAYASVPLYDWFCRVTGYGGTTQVSADESRVILDRTITVRFDATTSPDLPWKFQPVQRENTMRVGENAISYYRATNTSDKTIVGTATFNVTPLKAGPYFTKIDCFCFTEQKLVPGESVEMPVTYFVDADIDEDPNLEEVKTITLSYTFFEADVDEDASDEDTLASLDTSGSEKD